MHVGCLNLQRAAMNRLQLMRAKPSNNTLKIFGYNGIAWQPVTDVSKKSVSKQTKKVALTLKIGLTDFSVMLLGWFHPFYSSRNPLQRGEV
jgi:hypothetical protein